MYHAKDRGRNNVQIFTPIMNRKLKQRVTVEAMLREALNGNQLDVYYQPFIDLRSRKIVGLEALLRWKHPLRGMMPTDSFIPVAEETGLIIPIGELCWSARFRTSPAGVPPGRNCACVLECCGGPATAG